MLIRDSHYVSCPSGWGRFCKRCVQWRTAQSGGKSVELAAIFWRTTHIQANSFFNDNFYRQVVLPHKKFPDGRFAHSRPTHEHIRSPTGTGLQHKYEKDPADQSYLRPGQKRGATFTEPLPSFEKGAIIPRWWTQSGSTLPTPPHSYLGPHQRRRALNTALLPENAWFSSIVNSPPLSHPHPPALRLWTWTFMQR